MTIDNIINKYGTHDLDINFCITDGTISTIFAYCHKHNVDGQFMVNHYLKVTGKLSVLKADVDDESDVYIHIACVEKISDSIYEISGVGGYVKFSTDEELLAEEVTEEDYNKQLQQA